MAHFFAEVQGSRGPAHRLGGKDGGVRAMAKGWRGSVTVQLYHEDGNDMFVVVHKANDGEREIARGPLDTVIARD